MKDKKGLSTVLFLFFSVGFLVAFHGTALSQSSYKIGYTNSHSGFLAFMGNAWKEGFFLGVDQTNAAGGINGHKMDVVMYDDESDISKAVLTVKKLIDTDKVLMIVGGNFSGIGIACAPIADKAKVPYLCLASSRWAVAKPGKWKLPGDPPNPLWPSKPILVSSENPSPLPIPPPYPAMIG